MDILNTFSSEIIDVILLAFIITQSIRISKLESKINIQH